MHIELLQENFISALFFPAAVRLAMLTSAKRFSGPDATEGNLVDAALNLCPLLPTVAALPGFFDLHQSF
jgi:hypothetical protein